MLGGIEQTFATIPGQRYLLLFDLSGNPEGGPLLKTMRVSVAGVSQDFTFDSTGQAIDALLWQPIALAFMARGMSATLSFTSLSSTPNSYGALVDNVSVTPIPEPSTLLLAARGLLGTLRQWTSRRRAAARGG